ncbi:MAG TPA: hypothetical protein VHR42_05095 [Clostridia bacterium]|nr:hypothetical protein [Clostridia bacterium]
MSESKLLTVFRRLKERKAESGMTADDAEMAFIDRMIRELESDAQKQRVPAEPWKR